MGVTNSLEGARQRPPCAAILRHLLASLSAQSLRFIAQRYSELTTQQRSGTPSHSGRY